MKSHAFSNTENNSTSLSIVENYSNLARMGIEAVLGNYSWPSEEERDAFFKSLRWKIRLLFITLNRLRNVSRDEITNFLSNCTQPEMAMETGKIADIFYCYSDINLIHPNAIRQTEEQKILLKLHELDAITLNIRKEYLSTLANNLPQSLHAKRFHVITHIMLILNKKEIELSSAQLEKLISHVENSIFSYWIDNNLFSAFLNRIEEYFSANDTPIDINVILHKIAALLHHLQPIEKISLSLSSAGVPMEEEKISDFYYGNLFRMVDEDNNLQKNILGHTLYFFDNVLTKFKSPVTEDEFKWLFNNISLIDKVSEILTTTENPEGDFLPLIQSNREIIELTGENISVIAYLMDAQKRCQTLNTHDYTFPWIEILDNAVTELAIKEILNFSRFHDLLENMPNAENITRVLSLIPFNEDNLPPELQPEHEWSQDECIRAFEELVRMATRAGAIHVAIQQNVPCTRIPLNADGITRNIYPTLTPEKFEKILTRVECTSRLDSAGFGGVDFFGRRSREFRISPEMSEPASNVSRRNHG